MIKTKAAGVGSNCSNNYWARTAAEIMAPNPLSIGADATVADAIAFLALNDFTAAPVIDQAGRPVGVLSQSDILIHQREGEATPVKPGQAAHPAQVCDLMTPAVFSVAPETSVMRAVEQMVSLKVHRLFVVDQAGILVGVVSALDVLRGLVRASGSVPVDASW
jgi:CBS domain-containing protein